MAKMGRPLKEIDQEEFEKLCGLMCRKREMANWFNVCEDTLERWVKKTYGEDKTFAQVYEQKMDNGRVSLRRAQFAKAMSGQMNVPLLIFLGKNYLEQRDVQKVDVSGSMGITHAVDTGLLEKLISLCETKSE